MAEGRGHLPGANDLVRTERAGHLFDDLLLLTINPAGNDDEKELPGLQDEVHS